MNASKPTTFIRQDITLNRNKRDCFPHNTFVRGDSDDLVTPIQINAMLNLKRDNSKETSFCKDCPVFDPNFSRHQSEIIKFRTGCAQSERCLSDLQLKAYVANLSDGKLILGKNNVITVIVEIQNLKEPAYKTEFIVHLPENVKVVKEENCRQESTNEFILTCLIGNPFQGKSVKREIQLDTSEISSSEDIISIFILSKTLSEEINPKDNYANITIPIKLIADITIIGRTDNEQVLLKESKAEPDIYEVVHIYNVMKHYYSPISSVTVSFFIPTSLIGAETKFLNLKSVKILTDDSFNSVTGNCNFTNVDDEMTKTSDENFTISLPRSKRNVNDEIVKNNKAVTNGLNKNPTFNCNNSVCQKIVCSVGPFDQKKKTAIFHIKGSVNVTVFKSTLKEWNNLTFLTEGEVWINDNRTIIQPENNLPHEAKVITTIVRSITLMNTKIANWILPVSIACGVVLITIIIVALLKMGFFRRKQKEDLETYKANLQLQEDSGNNIDEN